MTEQTTTELDLRGLTCPMPLLKTKQALNRMSPGEVIKVTATDPGSERDFKVFAAQSGNELLRLDNDGHCFHYWLKKG